jgi:hypothetical protein
MSTPNRLSYSAINTFNSCGQKYKFHYVDRLRSKTTSSPLVFGSAIDEALNELLVSRDLAKSLAVFEKKWNFQYVNGKYTDLANTDLVTYSDSDMDTDLVEPIVAETYEGLSKQKKETGQLSAEEVLQLNRCFWHSLRAKGRIMIESYNKKIMPRVKQTLAVQHETSLVNAEGDVIKQILDAVVVWEDDSIILMDNKTAARAYADDSAATSPQLISYYHKAKEEFGVQAVGFIVMEKNIRKNRIKICSKCETDGSSSRAKTCDVETIGMVIKRGKEVEGTVRCDGEWKVTLDPECVINVIVDTVSEVAEDLVLSSFQEANDAIKTGRYTKNLSACKSPFPCQFYDKCWKGKEDNLIVLEKKE